MRSILVNFHIIVEVFLQPSSQAERTLSCCRGKRSTWQQTEAADAALDREIHTGRLVGKLPLRHIRW